MSASAGSELAMLAGSENGIVGKLRAAMGLLGLWQLSHDFGHQLREQQADVALCTFQSIAAIPALQQWAKPFILILHDAKFHPGDYYPFRERVLGGPFAAIFFAVEYLNAETFSFYRSVVSIFDCHVSIIGRIWGRTH